MEVFIVEYQGKPHWEQDQAEGPPILIGEKLFAFKCLRVDRLIPPVMTGPDK